MATVIDSFILEWENDPKKFIDGLKKINESLEKSKKESERVAKEMEAQGKKAGRFFEQLRNQALALFAVFTAGRGIKDFVHDITRMDFTLGNVARSLNMNARDLFAWQGAAKATGGSAEEMRGTLQNITQELAHFQNTGEYGNILSYLRSPALGIEIRRNNGTLKTAGELLLEVQQHLRGLDPRKIMDIVQNLGGGQTLFNLITRNKSELLSLLATYAKLAPTAEDIAAADKRTSAWNQFLLTLEKLGRTILTELTPAINHFLEVLTQLANWVAEHPVVLNGIFAGLATIVAALTVSMTGGLLTAVTTFFGVLGTSATAALGPIGLLAAALGGIVAAYTWMSNHADEVQKWTKNALGEKTYSFLQRGGQALAQGMANEAPSSGGGDLLKNMSQEETIAYIRESAAKRGINPDIAVEVARREGLNNYTGDQGSSFGPFQLHYGGIAPGGNAVSGLGDAFTKDTGLDARNPATIRQQVDYALDHAARYGWKDFHGWTGTAFAGIGPGASAALNEQGGKSTTTTEIHIGNIVVHTQATDAEGIAHDIQDAIRRNAYANQANYGAN